ncbi:MAG: pantetheine-phosphate adenylyltransferase [Dehalococcoidia bacterium]
MVNAIYPGSFDPVHNGHVDIAKRASMLFDKLIVGVYDVPPKELMFSTAERVNMFKESIDSLPNVEVVSFEGLAPSFALEVNADFIVRGLRAGYDFEYEFEMTHMWRNLVPEIDVVCMMSALEYQFVYASRIKEVARLGGNVDNLIPKNVSNALKAKLTK